MCWLVAAILSQTFRSTTSAITFFRKFLLRLFNLTNIWSLHWITHRWRSIFGEGGSGINGASYRFAGRLPQIIRFEISRRLPRGSRLTHVFSVPYVLATRYYVSNLVDPVTMGRPASTTSTKKGLNTKKAMKKRGSQLTMLHAGLSPRTYVGLQNLKDDPFKEGTMTDLERRRKEDELTNLNWRIEKEEKAVSIQKNLIIHFPVDSLAYTEAIEILDVLSSALARSRQRKIDLEQAFYHDDDVRNRRVAHALQTQEVQRHRQDFGRIDLHPRLSESCLSYVVESAPQRKGLRLRSMNLPSPVAALPSTSAGLLKPVPARQGSYIPPQQRLFIQTKMEDFFPNISQKEVKDELEISQQPQIFCRHYSLFRLLSPAGKLISKASLKSDCKKSCLLSSDASVVTLCTKKSSVPTSSTPRQGFLPPPSPQVSIVSTAKEEKIEEPEVVNSQATTLPLVGTQADSDPVIIFEAPSPALSIFTGTSLNPICLDGFMDDSHCVCDSPANVGNDPDYKGTTYLFLESPWRGRRGVTPDRMSPLADLALHDCYNHDLELSGGHLVSRWWPRGQRGDIYHHPQRHESSDIGASPPLPNDSTFKNGQK